MLGNDKMSLLLIRISLYFYQKKDSATGIFWTNFQKWMTMEAAPEQSKIAAYNVIRFIKINISFGILIRMVHLTVCYYHVLMISTHCTFQLFGQFG